jgi:Na+/proline symporter
MNGILLLAVYTTAMVGITLLATKKSETATDFHVGDRKMGIISSALSTSATWVWAPALFTSAEKAYANGIPGLFWFLVPNVLCLLLFMPFAKRIRERMPDGITLSGFMGREYGAGVKGVYLFQLSALAVLSTGVQLLAGGKILSMVTDIPFFAVTVILAVIAFSYSWFSGIRASVITDALQMILILAACMIFVPWALQGDGVGNLANGLTGVSGQYGDLFSSNGVEVFITFGLPTTIGLIAAPFGDQCLWQRAFAIDRKGIGKSFVLSAVLFGVVPLSMGILGFIAAGSGFVPSDQGVVNLELVTHLFPAWASIPFIFMLISGLLSTVDSNLCAAASLTTD